MTRTRREAHTRYSTRHTAILVNAASSADVRSPHRSHHGNPVRGADGRYHGAVRPSEEDLPEKSIDHVYFTGGLHALRQHVDVDQEALDVSDHSPVVVEFELKCFGDFLVSAEEESLR